MPTAPDPAVRVAALDCGTNSLRLLVADLDPATGTQVDVQRALRIVRLGQGVDASGSLHPDAVARLLAGCDELAGLVADAGATRVRFCATSAARDAAAVQDVEAGVRARFGVPVEVITGAEEARLTAVGAARGLAGMTLPEPLLVVDIGGGSTELATLAADGVLQVHSVQVGSVRLTERLMAGEQATAAQRQAVRDAVDAALGGVWPGGEPVPVPRGLVVVGGTAVTVAGHVLGLAVDRLADSHRARPALGDVLAACDRLAAMPVAQRAALRCMLPGREDVIGAGALVLERVVLAVRDGLADDVLTVSTHDLLDGIAWSML